MAGASAHAAEVVRGSDDAAAKMILPDAVHHHAGGERIVRIGHPLGQFGARMLQIRGKLRCRIGQQNSQGPHPDCSALVLIFATRQDVDGGLVLHIVGDGLDGRNRFGHSLLQLFHLLQDLLALIRSGAAHGHLELLQLRLNRFGLCFPRRLFFGGCAGQVFVLRRSEKCLNAVVVALANGIELMIVAAGAAERYA